MVDARGLLVGQVALQPLNLGAGEELRGVIAYDIMRPPPTLVTPSQTLLEVLPVILASNQRNIPRRRTLSRRTAWLARWPGRRSSASFPR